MRFGGTGVTIRTRRRSSLSNVVVVALVGVAHLSGRAGAQDVNSASTQGRAVVIMHATGTFDVKLNPEASDTPAEGSTLGRLSLDKQWHGDLEATSKGVMLTASSNEKNSAGYVAVERVTGTLRGKTGTFALQHSGTMNRGAPTLVISVVPDSGTGELLGMAGTLKIIIEGGKHSYDLEYTLATSPSP